MECLNLEESASIKIRDEGHIKSSIRWNFNNSAIEIDDSSPSKDWVTTEKDNVWCSGSGTGEDPYIIENVFNCRAISIKNFIIKNCTNKISEGWATYIWLSQVKYGQIIKNLAVIHLDGSDDNIISENKVNGDFIAGISIRNSHNNDIRGNNVYDNEEYGIYLYKSTGNSISKNKLEENHDFGIYLESSEDNSIKKNEFSNNDGEVFLENSNDNSIKENEFISDEDLGISLKKSDDNSIRENKIKFEDTFDSGIYLISSDKNEISENEIIYKSLNLMDDKYYFSDKEIGICLSKSDHNQLEDNTIKFNRIGVELTLSNDNLISSNKIIGSRSRDIVEDPDCERNVIENNYCEHDIFLISLTTGGVIFVSIYIIYKKKKSDNNIIQLIKNLFQKTN